MPNDIAGVWALAYRYGELRAADDDALAAEPITVSPLQFRRNLGCARARFDAYADLSAVADELPATDRERTLTGRECRGVVHKLVGEPAVPVLLSGGAPPRQGVWEPQTIRAVAAAKALANEKGRDVERAFYEYPAHGVVREVPLTTWRKAAYRRVVRTMDALDGSPASLDDDATCEPCPYRNECGVRSRSLRSLLGL